MKANACVASAGGKDACIFGAINSLYRRDARESSPEGIHRSNSPSFTDHRKRLYGRAVVYSAMGYRAAPPGMI